MVKLTASSIFNITTPHSFGLKINQQQSSANLTLSLNTSHLYASDLKDLLFLDQTLPTIYNHKCFNYKNQSFKDEVLHTELGHLYEHILLEYLYLLKSKTDVIKGLTHWDWSKDPKGTFRIKISSYAEDLYLLREAVSQTNSLMHNLISPQN